MKYIEGDSEADAALLGAITNHLRCEIKSLLKQYSDLVPTRLSWDLQDQLSEMRIWFDMPQSFSPNQGVPDFPHVNDYEVYVGDEVPSRKVLAECAGGAVEELLDDNFARDVNPYRRVLDKYKE